MSLRARIHLLIIILHLMTGFAVGYALWDDHRPWILFLEIALAASLFISFYLTRGFNLPYKILQTGKDFIIERDFSHTFSPVAEHEVSRLVNIYNDMIRKLREERIQNEEKQAFLEKVVAASPIGILTLDADGNIQLANEAAARFLSVPFRDLPGKTIPEIGSPVGQALLDLSADEAVVISLPDRTRLRCSRSLYFERGMEQSFYLIIDLTRELMVSERHAYETLIRTLSHEVNNTIGATNSILRSCLVYGTQLNEEDRQDFEKAMNVAIQRTDSLNLFMRRFADVVRLPDPEPLAVQIVTLLENVAAAYSREVIERRIDLKWDIQVPTAKVLVDPPQMEQVFQNILRNAMEAVEQDGRILIQLTREKEDVILKIADSGPGLSPEARESLFTPFFSTKKTGQGIGLTLVREILLRHGLLFSLTNGEGSSATFTIRFPLHLA